MTIWQAIQSLPTLHRLFYTYTCLSYLVSSYLSYIVSAFSLDVGLAIQTGTCGVESKTETVGIVTFCYFSGFLDEPRNEGSSTAPSTPFLSYLLDRDEPIPTPLRIVLLGNDRYKIIARIESLPEFPKYPAPPIQPYLSKIQSIPSLYPFARSTRDIPILHQSTQSTFNIFSFNPTTTFDHAWNQSISSTCHSQPSSQTPVVSQIPSHLPIIPIHCSLLIRTITLFPGIHRARIDCRETESSLVTVYETPPATYINPTHHPPSPLFFHQQSTTIPHTTVSERAVLHRIPLLDDNESSRHDNTSTHSIHSLYYPHQPTPPLFIIPSCLPYHPTNTRRRPRTDGFESSEARLRQVQYLLPSRLLPTGG